MSAEETNNTHLHPHPLSFSVSFPTAAPGLAQPCFCTIWNYIFFTKTHIKQQLSSRIIHGRVGLDGRPVLKTGRRGDSCPNPHSYVISAQGTGWCSKAPSENKLKRIRVCHRSSSPLCSGEQSVLLAQMVTFTLTSSPVQVHRSRY